MSSSLATSDAQLNPEHSLSIAQTCPADVLAQIFESVDPRGSLKSCNLTCHGWYTSSFPVLFRKVSVHEKHPSQVSTRDSESRLALLRAHLSTTTCLNSSVRELVVKGEADFAALQAVVTQLVALRTLQLLDVTFGSLDDTEASEWEFPKTAISLDRLVLVDDSPRRAGRAPLLADVISPNRPGVFDVLGWFDSIKTLEISGFKLDTTTYLKNEAVTTSVDHVKFVLRVGYASFHGHCSILQKKIDVNSIRRVTFSSPGACMTAIVEHFLRTFGANVVECNLTYVVVCPPMAGHVDTVSDIIARDGIIHFAGISRLQRLRMRLQTITNEVGIPFLCEQWKYLMANLVGQVPDLTMHLHVVVAGRREPLMIMEAIDWSLLNNLVVGRRQPPSIKIAVSWVRSADTLDFPTPQAVITANTSPSTRSRLIYVEAEQCEW